MKKINANLLWPVIGLGLLLWPDIAQAADGTWITNGFGNWSDPGNWQLGIVADGKDGVANFTPALTTSGAVYLTSDRTIGHMVFSDTAGLDDWWYLESATGQTWALTLANASPLVPIPTIKTDVVTYVDVELKGEQGFTKLGDSILMLQADSSYEGPTTILQGMVVVDTAEFGLGFPRGIANATTVVSGAHLAVQGGELNEDLEITGNGMDSAPFGSRGAVSLWNASSLSGNITAAGETSIAAQSDVGTASRITGDISLSAGATLSLRAMDNDIEVSGPVTGSGNLRTSETAHTVILTTASGHTGQTIVDGNLRLEDNQALGSSTVALNSSRLSFDAMVTQPVFGGLSGSADLDLAQGGVTRTLTVGGNGQGTAYSGGLLGEGCGLTKVGDGTLTLSGDNSLNGLVKVQAGTLSVNGGTSTFGNVSVIGSSGAEARLAIGGGMLSVAGLVGVGTDGTLDMSEGAIFSADRVTSMGGSVGGTGTIQANLENEEGGVVSPGNSAGILTVDGYYIQKSGATLEIELGGLIRGDEYDAIVVLGNADFRGGDLDVVLINGFMPSAGDSFDILDWGSLTDMSFNNVNLPALSGGNTWDASTIDTTGTISVIPEPSTLLLVILGAGGAMGWRKRALPRAGKNA